MSRMKNGYILGKKNIFNDPVRGHSITMFKVEGGVHQNGNVFEQGEGRGFISMQTFAYTHFLIEHLLHELLKLPDYMPENEGRLPKFLERFTQSKF